MLKRKSARVVDLDKVRLAQPFKMPDGTLAPPGVYYEPRVEYSLDPRRVIKFRIKGLASSDKP